jgi:hypothetical protein
VVSEWSSPSLSLLFQLPNCARPLLLTMTPSTSAYARLATSLKRALGPAGADGRLATDAAAAARRLAGVGAVRDPPAGGGGGGEGAASTSTTTPAGPPLSPAAAAALARDWSRLVDAVRVHQVRACGEECGEVRGGEGVQVGPPLSRAHAVSSFLFCHRTSSPRTTSV